MVIRGPTLCINIAACLAVKAFKKIINSFFWGKIIRYIHIHGASSQKRFVWTLLNSLLLCVQQLNGRACWKSPVSQLNTLSHSLLSNQLEKHTHTPKQPYLNTQTQSCVHLHAHKPTDTHSDTIHALILLTSTNALRYPDVSMQALKHTCAFTHAQAFPHPLYLIKLPDLDFYFIKCCWVNWGQASRVLKWLLHW